ncbi:hypothetical protein PVAND_004392 [Polypedilum vanderplanki]|uniref:Uncharacterized protein n=1 Tax=Polypedilum vanderplanki TaxID=319348 RepID=A0A9J6BX02_POLVA|nr:hypothetical protein PVAND_004392 [Polypedilum vanderplanki]
MSFVDLNEITRLTKSCYKVLTCRSRKANEKKIELPTPIFSSSIPETGCIINNDNEPEKFGIAAVEYNCGNIAYVGKRNISNFVLPGRIQTVNESGLYILDAGKKILIKKQTLYLADNPNNSYYWIDSNGDILPNNVFIYAGGSFMFPIARAKINGQTKIGYVLDTRAYFPSDKDSTDVLTNYDVLVCDLWSKYQCSQQLKKYNLENSPSIDGFSVGIYKDDIISYIGRSLTNCENGCD